jgi:hypothetical protein
VFCGYPTIELLINVDLTQSDISELNFVVDIQASFGASNLSADFKIGSFGFERRVLPVTDKKQFSQ